MILPILRYCGKGRGVRINRSHNRVRDSTRHYLPTVCGTYLTLTNVHTQTATFARIGHTHTTATRHLPGRLFHLLRAQKPPHTATTAMYFHANDGTNDSSDRALIPAIVPLNAACFELLAALSNRVVCRCGVREVDRCILRPTGVDKSTHPHTNTLRESRTHAHNHAHKHTEQTHTHTNTHTHNSHTQTYHEQRQRRHCNSIGLV